MLQRIGGSPRISAFWREPGDSAWIQGVCRKSFWKMLCVKRKTTQQETAAESTPQAMGAFISSSRGSPGRSVHTSTGLSCSSKGWAGSSSGHGRGIPLPEVMVQGVSVPEALEYKAKLLLADGVTDVTWLDDVASVTVPLETLVMISFCALRFFLDKIPPYFPALHRAGYSVPVRCSGGPGGRGKSG